MTVSDPAKAPKPKSVWSPFQALTCEAEAKSAGRAGAVISGYIGVSYLVQVGMVQWLGRDGFGHCGSGAMLGDAFGVALAALLTVIILVRQPLWAAVMVTAWFAVEMGSKLWAIWRGTSHPGVGFAVMSLALVVAVILSLRGSWRLMQLRRGLGSRRDDEALANKREPAPPAPASAP